MEIKDQPKLRFHGVDIINVLFTSMGLKKESKIDIQVEPQVFMPTDHPEVFKIIMKVNLTGEESFRLELVALGNFEISFSEEITPEIRKNLINANATAIMFPYIRAFISTFTANLGNTTGSISIPTKFFKGEIKEFISTSDNILLNDSVEKFIK
jgi:preprotein translocase subunit SecB